jgi:hypothetical protein
MIAPFITFKTIAATAIFSHASHAKLATHLLAGLPPQLFFPQWLLWLRILSIACFICGAIPAVIFAINSFVFRRPGSSWNRRPLPPLSVLIPARNEEANIAACIEAVLLSRGVDLEIIVLDDGSTDRTAEIVQAIAEEDLRIRLETADPLPDGWNGKQHACWQLAAKSDLDVFCFLDADVRVGPEAFYRTLTELNFQDAKHTELSLVSGFPAQTTRTVFEWLLLPLIHFILLGFLPLIRQRLSLSPGFAAGCGQFMMVRREAYFATEGHSAIRATMHDGILLPRLFRQNGFYTSVFDLSQDASCRMYRGTVELWRGLTKNATEGMATILRLPLFTVILLLGQLPPLPLLVWSSIVLDVRSARMVFLATIFSLAIPIISAARYRQSWLGVLFRPVGIVVLLILQWLALLRKLLRIRSKWKDRAYRVG